MHTDLVIQLLHLAEVTFPAEHPLAGQLGVVNGFAIHHESGLVLVDTSLDWGNADVDTYYRPARRLPYALAEHGLRILDIHLVINTQLHFDHCGQNALFPSVPILCAGGRIPGSSEPWRIRFSHDDAVWEHED